jgi:hypothetical protein
MPIEFPDVDIAETQADRLTLFPLDEQFTDVAYKHVETGHLFFLAVTEPNIYGRTHFLKNKKEVWEGTVKAFRETFEKV